MRSAIEFADDSCKAKHIQVCIILVLSNSCLPDNFGPGKTVTEAKSDLQVLHVFSCKKRTC